LKELLTAIGLVAPRVTWQVEQVRSNGDQF